MRAAPPHGSGSPTARPKVSDRRRRPRPSATPTPRPTGATAPACSPRRPGAPIPFLRSLWYSIGMEAVSTPHQTHLRCPHNRARACHAVSCANGDRGRLDVAGKSICLRHTPRVTNVIHGMISISCASLPRHTARHRRALEHALFHAEPPEWVCAELRSLTTATNLVSWPKASFGNSVVHERDFR